MSDLMSKQAADAQFEQGDDCASCEHCDLVEEHPGQFVTCRRCKQPVCSACCYEETPDLCGVCFDQVINKIAALGLNS